MLRCSGRCSVDEDRTLFLPHSKRESKSARLSVHLQRGESTWKRLWKHALHSCKSNTTTSTFRTLDTSKQLTLNLAPFHLSTSNFEIMSKKHIDIIRVYSSSSSSASVQEYVDDHAFGNTFSLQDGPRTRRDCCPSFNNHRGMQHQGAFPSLLK